MPLKAEVPMPFLSRRYEWAVVGRAIRQMGSSLRDSFVDPRHVRPQRVAHGLNVLTGFSRALGGCSGHVGVD